MEEKKHVEGTKIEDITGMKFNHWTVLGFDWDRYEIQIKNRKNIKRIRNYWFCQCDCKDKTIKSVRSDSLQNNSNKSCGCDKKDTKGIKMPREIKYEDSFGSWFVENFGLYSLEKQWDYSKNSVNPFEIAKTTSTKIWIKCIDSGYHDSYDTSPNKFYYGHRCPYCSMQRIHKKDSFAQYHIDNTDKDFINKYWGKKNMIDPFTIAPKSTSTRVWVVCQDKDYHEEYQIKCSEFTNGGRCNYCSSNLVHPLDSFGQWCIDNVDKDFVEKYWGKKNLVSLFTIPKMTMKKIFIKCQHVDYHGEYEMTPNQFLRGTRCPYCSGTRTNYLDSFGTHNQDVLHLWSDKNKKSPYEYNPQSGVKVWWKCPDGKHEDYLRTISNAVKYEFRCWECTKERNSSMLQTKVKDYIENFYGYKLRHEWSCSIVPINPKTKYPLPFDNEIVDLKLIIEVHGEAHYKIDGLIKMNAKKYKTSPSYELYKRKLYDRYKAYTAYIKGYHYLEIPYWTENDESYVVLIDTKIKEILKGDS